MSRRIVTGYYQGLDLAAHATRLKITATGEIGRDGVVCAGPISVSNAGRIEAYANLADGYVGLRLNGGGTVTNSAYIEGSSGIIVANAPGAVVNRGTILGVSNLGYGVRLQDGGVVTNGAKDHSAQISGYTGVFIYGPHGAVNNFGTITGLIGPSSVGVYLLCPGQVVNGSKTDSEALIEGESRGVGLVGSTSLINFGTIASVGYGYGVFLREAGASVTNGAAGHTQALIEGYDGVVAYTGDTVTNFGTISGEGGGAALTFGPGGGVLVVEAGCNFNGAVLGGGGELVLDSGTGSLIGLPGEGTITVFGSMAPAAFQDFNTLRIGAAAQFGLTGSGSIATGQTISDAGTLVLATMHGASVANAGLIETSGAGMLTIIGGLANAGTLIADGGVLMVAGAVTGAGSAQIAAGTLQAMTTFDQAVAFTGTSGTLVLGDSRHYGGAISGFSTSGQTTLDLLDIGYVAGSTTATFSGTTKGGVLTVTTGAISVQITLMGNYLGTTFTASSDHQGGVNVIDTGAVLIRPAAFTAAMASIAAPGGQMSVGHSGWADRPASLVAPRSA